MTFQELRLEIIEDLLELSENESNLTIILCSIEDHKVEIIVIGHFHNITWPVITDKIYIAKSKIMANNKIVHLWVFKNYWSKLTNEGIGFVVIYKKSLNVHSFTLKRHNIYKINTN